MVKDSYVSHSISGNDIWISYIIVYYSCISHINLTNSIILFMKIEKMCLEGIKHDFYIIPNLIDKISLDFVK